MKEEISSRMKLLISLLGTNQNKLSKEMGYYNTMIGNVINMRNLPSFEFLNRLKKTIPKLDMNWFITGEGNQFIDHVPINTNKTDSETLTIYKDLIESLKRENGLLRDKIAQLIQLNDCECKKPA